MYSSRMDVTRHPGAGVLEQDQTQHRLQQYLIACPVLQTSSIRSSWRKGDFFNDMARFMKPRVYHGECHSAHDVSLRLSQGLLLFLIFKRVDFWLEPRRISYEPYQISQWDLLMGYVQYGISRAQGNNEGEQYRS